MLFDFSGDDADGSGSRTVVRFHDHDGELLAELENAAVPGTGETVTLRAMRMMEGPPSPELVDVGETGATWDDTTVTRRVDDVEYELRWMQYPDDTATPRSSHVTLVDVHLARTDESE